MATSNGWVSKPYTPNWDLIVISHKVQSLTWKLKNARTMHRKARYARQIRALRARELAIRIARS